jgi:chloramphenicol O-acetyltransferase type A
MANRWKAIDEAHWDRAVHAKVFRNYLDPCFCVTFEVDVTDFHRMTKENGYSFTLAMVHAVCAAANGIENLRYRFLDGKPVLFDRIDTAFTYLDKDTQLFKVVRVPFIENLQEYCAIAKQRADEQTAYFTGPLGNDIFMCSPIPWVSYTHISHTNSGAKDNATPLFDWGKYTVKGERLVMPFSVQAHHSFVDGIHIGMLADALKAELDG